MLTAERARTLLDYDPLTGVFARILHGPFAKTNLSIFLEQRSTPAALIDLLNPAGI